LARRSSAPQRELERLFAGAERLAGVDEAGRGALAGPVCAAAVILPDDFDAEGVRDSKTLTARQRDRLRSRIESAAVAWAVAYVEPEEIDRINILQASLEAMRQAAMSLKPEPDWLVVDGHFLLDGLPFQQTARARADRDVLSVAAASILAKTHRDERMKELDELFPGYGWSVNKGYPTALHRQAIQRMGPSPRHRHSFRLLPD